MADYDDLERDPAEKLLADVQFNIQNAPHTALKELCRLTEKNLWGMNLSLFFANAKNKGSFIKIPIINFDSETLNLLKKSGMLDNKSRLIIKKDTLIKFIKYPNKLDTHLDKACKVAKLLEEATKDM